MEHWLPLFEERLTTLFDHLGENDLIVRDARRRPGARGSSARRSRTITPTASGRCPANPAAIVRSSQARSICPRTNGRRRSASRPIHLTSPFPEPESERIVDFGVEPARDFAPERTQQAQIYEAVVEHVAKLRKSGHKVVLASYSAGARERLAGLLADHGLEVAEAGRQLAGSAGHARRSRR